MYQYQVAENEENEMNYWRGEKICIRAMEEDDGDLFYQCIQNMEIQYILTEPIMMKSCMDLRWMNT